MLHFSSSRPIPFYNTCLFCTQITNPKTPDTHITAGKRVLVHCFNQTDTSIAHPLSELALFPRSSPRCLRCISQLAAEPAECICLPHTLPPAAPVCFDRAKQVSLAHSHEGPRKKSSRRSSSSSSNLLGRNHCGSKHQPRTAGVDSNGNCSREGGTRDEDAAFTCSACN